MTIQQFIEKAIEGGWDFTDNVNFSEEDRARFKRTEHLKDPKNIAGFWGAVFLDPLAWQAVGKVEGWKSLDDSDWATNAWMDITPEWHVNMRNMIDALAGGKTTEQYLETL